jgi:hypothetical protein
MGIRSLVVAVTSGDPQPDDGHVVTWRTVLDREHPVHQVPHDCSLTPAVSNGTSVADELPISST